MFREIDVDEVMTCLKTAARLARTEEDLRVRASRCIEEKILEPLGVNWIGRYEYTFVSGGRADALYGHVIVEYKAPGRLSAEGDIARAKEQVARYIIAEAGVEERYRDFLGIIISDRVAFVRYNHVTGQWVLRGPYDINRESVIKLIEALRGLRRKRLGVEELLTDFGRHPKTGKMSPLAERAVKTLYRRLTSSESRRVRMLFEDWRRLFTQATGYSPEKLRGLEKEYGVTGGDVDYDALLFAIHTYYALIMKLLAAEIAYLYGAGRWLKSYVAELEDAYMRGVGELRKALEELESGGIFKRLLGITNFIEGDYFSWYLDVLDQELADVIAGIARKLADYEPATPHLEPESTRDLLKRLYQHLVPKKIRHDLGEYYTPDWLAELVLDEVGYTEEYFEELARDDPLAPFKLRLLDPASGSGTFLVIALRRLRSYAEKHFMQDIMADYVLKNLVGYDLNPLAVLAARTNYLLAIADILSYARGKKEIPVYLADSILVESRTALDGSFYILRTSVGVFEVPKQIVDEGLLGELLNLIEYGVRSFYGEDEFLELFRVRLEPRLGKDSTIDHGRLKKLYRLFLKLEEKGENHVWISIIRNAFAPLLKGRFDYVVGNPPWVNWENLPEAYRRASESLWARYGLVPPRKGAPSIGRVKRDLSMLFTARSIDLYLKDHGKLGFVITYTVFVSKAGEGFRRFFARGVRDVKARILKVHDLEELLPFEGAQNRTAVLVAEKGAATSFPVECVVWKSGARSMPVEAELEEVERSTRRLQMFMVPLVPGSPESQWIEVIDPAIASILGKIVGGQGGYRAYAGVYTGLNSVYFVDVKERRDGLVLVSNQASGRRRTRQITVHVEEDLVYPLIKGRDLDKWKYELSGTHIILPVTSKGEVLSYKELKTRYPHAWQYFAEFFDDLISRSGEPYKSALKVYRDLRKRGASILEALQKVEQTARRAPPFYYVFNARPSLAPYKVAWKEVSSRLSKYGFSVTVIEPHPSGKPIVPDHTVLFIPLNDADEAYYVAGILNSIIVKLVSLYTTASNIQDLSIPKFDRRNKLHNEIASLSKKAHEAARQGDAEKLRELEERIDRLAAELFGVSEPELSMIKEMFKVARGCSQYEA